MIQYSFYYKTTDTNKYALELYINGESSLKLFMKK